MSYHDSYDRAAMQGISVVNPLIQIEQKFTKIRELLSDTEKIADLSAIDLKKLIEEIMQE